MTTGFLIQLLQGKNPRFLAKNGNSGDLNGNPRQKRVNLLAIHANPCPHGFEVIAFFYNQTTATGRRHSLGDGFRPAADAF